MAAGLVMVKVDRPIRATKCRALKARLVEILTMKEGAGVGVYWMTMLLDLFQISVNFFSNA
jgi:hypothetical protein